MYEKCIFQKSLRHLKKCWNYGNNRDTEIRLTEDVWHQKKIWKQIRRLSTSSKLLMGPHHRYIGGPHSVDMESLLTFETWLGDALDSRSRFTIWLWPCWAACITDMQYCVSIKSWPILYNNSKKWFKTSGALWYSVRVQDIISGCY